jgi:hypothetical protein
MDFETERCCELLRVLSLVSLASTSGRIHWSYGEPALDEKAASTCCTRKGRLVAPFRALPAPAVRDMVEEDWRILAIDLHRVHAGPISFSIRNVPDF